MMRQPGSIVRWILIGLFFGAASSVALLSKNKFMHIPSFPAALLTAVTTGGNIIPMDCGGVNVPVLAVGNLITYGLIGCFLGFLAQPRRRTGPTICSKCQYSLIGNVSGVCPECGTPRDPTVR